MGLSDTARQQELTGLMHKWKPTLAPTLTPTPAPTSAPPTQPTVCTGTYQEAASASGNGRTRPPPGTPCVPSIGGCVATPNPPNRWGNSYCWTEPEGTTARQWG